MTIDNCSNNSDMSRRKQAKPRAFLKLGEDQEKCTSLELLERKDKQHEGNRIAYLENQIKSDEFTETPEQQSDQYLNSAPAIKLKIKVSYETSAVYTKYERKLNLKYMYKLKLYIYSYDMWVKMERVRKTSVALYCCR